MKIELITTKKKLSKSYISQMRTATEHIMTIGLCLGHVIGVKKTAYEIAIIEYENDYYTKALNYILSSSNKKHMYRPSFNKRGSYNYNFKTEKDRITWWNSYKKMRSIALKNHIYI